MVHAGKKGNGCLALGLCVWYVMMIFMERDSTRVNENLALKGNQQPVGAGFLFVFLHAYLLCLVGSSRAACINLIDVWWRGDGTPVDVFATMTQRGCKCVAQETM